MTLYINELINGALERFDEPFEDTPPHQIVLATTMAAATLMFLTYLPTMSQVYRMRHNSSHKQRVIDLAYQVSKNLPPVKKYLNRELNKDLQSTKDKLSEQRSQMQLQDTIPEYATPPKLILREFGINPDECLFDFGAAEEDEEARKFTVCPGDGQDSGALYALHPIELAELLKEVYAKTALTNPLHDKWPRMSAMQAEVIRWCQDLFGGSQEGYGLITHGGTSSIIEAMSAYVIHARAKGIKDPEIVVPETAHAAFEKAATLCGAKLVSVPVDPLTGAVSAKEMKKYLSKRTAVMVGSAPSFMNGIEDPIEELCALAEEYGIPFHVDACLGGFLTAFLDTSGKPMDFRVRGVTSISADLHKYGCCPKGTSVCLFSEHSPALSVYAALNWPGGLYTTPGILDGSTSGARIAEIYTTLSYYGRDRYREISELIIAMRERIHEKILMLNEGKGVGTRDIYVFGDPKWSVLGFRSDTLNPHWIADEMETRGWKLNLLQQPKGFHLCLTHVHTLEGFDDHFIQDLTESIEAVKNYPADKKSSGNVKVYGAIEMMPTQVQKIICEQYQKTRQFFHATCTSLSFFNADEESEEADNDYDASRNLDAS